MQNSNQRILWLKVAGLAAIQGAITLTWLIYNFYLKDLFVAFGLPIGLATGLLIAENAVETVIEPVAGSLSDRAKLWMGTRLPFISLGIIAASVLFLAIPTVFLFGKIEPILWLLPTVAFLWAMVMAMFRSPALSLLRQCAPKDKLPQAASVLTIVGGLIGAWRFSAYNVILNVGVVFAFGIGSFSLLLAAVALRFFFPAKQDKPRENSENPDNLANLKRLIPTFILIFATGMAVAWGIRFQMKTLSMLLALQMGADRSSLGMVGFNLALAAIALPMGNFATKIGNTRAMVVSLLTLCVCLPLITLIPDAAAFIFFLGFIVLSFSLLLNGVVPFALQCSPSSKAGVGIGMYFGGFGAAMSIFDLFMPKYGELSATLNGTGAAIAFGLAMACILAVQAVADCE